MKEQIDLLGNAFRGLWKSYILELGSVSFIEQWSVTYICRGHYVETPYMDTPEEALGMAIKSIAYSVMVLK